MYFLSSTSQKKEFREMKFVRLFFFLIVFGKGKIVGIYSKSSRCVDLTYITIINCNYVCIVHTEYNVLCFIYE